MLSDRMREAINNQINAELYSGYLYLSMAGYFEAANLPGFAHWMKLQSQEEVSHAMRLFDYVNDRGARVNLKAVGEPPSDFASPLAVFEQALKHEQSVTRMINGIYALSIEENDFATQSELQWFIKEQVEEEKSAGLIVEQLRRAGEQGPALIIMDRQLAAREED